MPLSFEDIKSLYLRAEGNYLFVDAENDERKHVEAFLLQIALFEGVLIELAIKSLRNAKREKLASKKEKENYNFNAAINDLYLLKNITDEEFDNLHQYRKKRNKYVHEILSRNFKKLDSEAKKAYEDGRYLLSNIIEKLK